MLINRAAVNELSTTSEPEQAESQWFVLRAKPREDKRALENLKNQKYHVYAPRVKVEKLRRGKLDVVEESLFPGYLFIRLNTWSDNWGPIRSTRGVMGMVRFGLGFPPAMSDAEIAKLQYFEREENSVIRPQFQPGDAVTFASGPFKGIEAVFLEPDGERRAMVLLTFMQRTQTVRVDRTTLEPLSGR